MKNIKLRKEDVGIFIKKGCKVILYGVAMVLPYLSSKDVMDAICYSGDVGYSDAVGAIMESDMYSSAKDEVMELLKKDQDTEYYKSIIQVVKSNIYSNNKVNIIKNISEK